MRFSCYTAIDEKEVRNTVRGEGGAHRSVLDTSAEVLMYCVSYPIKCVRVGARAGDTLLHEASAADCALDLHRQVR